METSSRSLRNTYKWAQSRIRELTKEVKVKNNHFDFRCVEDANSIRQEFDEWLMLKVVIIKMILMYCFRIHW